MPSLKLVATAATHVSPATADQVELSKDRSKIIVLTPSKNPVRIILIALSVPTPVTRMESVTSLSAVPALVTVCPTDVREKRPPTCVLRNMAIDEVTVISPVMALGVNVVGPTFSTLNGPSSGAYSTTDHERVALRSIARC